MYENSRCISHTPEAFPVIQHDQGWSSLLCQFPTPLNTPIVQKKKIHFLFKYTQYSILHNPLVYRILEKILSFKKTLQFCNYVHLFDNFPPVEAS